VLANSSVARVTQKVSSADGAGHTVDALFWQELRAPAGKSPGFLFPGQSTFAARATPYSFGPFTPGPASIYVFADPSAPAGPGVGNPIGAITYSRPPLSADFISAAGARNAIFHMHYHDAIAASGPVTYDWSFADAASQSALAPLELRERDRMEPPTVTLTAPADRTRTHTAKIIVSGIASDNVGVSSVTVADKPVKLNGSRFSATVKLTAGRNPITVTATDAAGNATKVKVTVTYAPQCKVPKLAGKRLADAKRALNGANCKLGKVTEKRSDTIRAGRVISSNPSPGRTYGAGKRVNLNVSNGP
jgi:hypothetical protein